MPAGFGKAGPTDIETKDSGAAVRDGFGHESTTASQIHDKTMEVRANAMAHLRHAHLIERVERRGESARPVPPLMGAPIIQTKIIHVGCMVLAEGSGSPQAFQREAAPAVR